MERPFDGDTSAEARSVLVAGLRRMTPAQKLARLVALNRSVEQLARAGIRLRHPDATERQVKLMLARMWLDEATVDTIAKRLAETG